MASSVSSSCPGGALTLGPLARPPPLASPAVLVAGAGQAATDQGEGTVLVDGVHLVGEGAILEGDGAVLVWEVALRDGDGAAAVGEDPLLVEEEAVRLVKGVDRAQGVNRVPGADVGCEGDEEMVELLTLADLAVEGE